MDDRITFLGSKEQRDLNKYYSAADVLVVPSLYESFGLVVVESLACGTPVMVSDIPPLREIVGEDGVRVDPTSERAIADALLDLLGHEERRQQLSARGSERARRYAWETTAERTLAVYHAAVR